MDIQGFWYDGEQSGQQPAIAQIDSHGYLTLYSLPQPSTQAGTLKQQELYSGRFEDIKVSSRLGNTPRYFYFSDGQKFETRENDLVDQCVSRYRADKAHSLVYLLETRWRYVAIAVVLMILVVAWTGVYGVPTAAKAIAYVMPQVLTDQAGEQTLAFLDEHMMRPTELEEDVQQRVRSHFETIIHQHPEHNIRLHFRSSDIGANAFALPDGTIIFTDDMIRLAENDDELLSVMAHEVGHVVHRHGMRGVIQGSIVGFILMMMTGDATAATEFFLGIPVILTQLGYSRSFEHEADDYALEYMLKEQIDTAHFSRLMSRLQHQHCHEPLVGNDEDEPQHSCEEEAWQRYLSTHPSMQERIEKFQLKAQ